MTAPTRIAVLASGRGSNLQAILDAIAAGRLPAEVVGVFSDRPAAAALQRVGANLRWAHAPKEFDDRAAYEQALGDALAAVAPDWIICAGYMRILGADFVQRFDGRLVNIHPSLLPLHKGSTRMRGRWTPAMPSTVPACTWSCPSWTPAPCWPRHGCRCCPAMTRTAWLHACWRWSIPADRHPAAVVHRPPG